MRIHVKFFAILREQAGTAQAEFDVPQGALVADVLDRVIGQFPATAGSLAKSAVAVNRAYVSRDTALKDSDELALIPPVSGG